MYPYIHIFGLKVYMTGVGILIAIMCFIFLVNHYGKKYQLNFWKFFNFLPVFLILPYLFGAYFYFLIELKKIIPWDMQDLMLIISPYGYRFNFIGITIGFFVAFYYFFKKIKINTEIFKRLDVFFYAISLSIIPLGIFLLLGDNFIGKATESVMGVSSFMQDSNLYKFDKVYPVGLYLSIVGLLSFVVTFFLHFVKRNYDVGIVGFVVLILLMNIPFVFQQYPRHLVLGIGDNSWDIKNYWTVILVIGIIVYYVKLKNIDENKNIRKR